MIASDDDPVKSKTARVVVKDEVTIFNKHSLVTERFNK